MRFLILGLFLSAGAAHANDGFGGLSATGLTFGQTDAVAMESEDLRIGPDRVEVTYVFRNLTEADVTGEVIFPLPPIGLSHLMMSDWNLPDDLAREDLVNFTATVDGQPVAVTLDRIAVIEPEWDENRALSEQYDTPGQDVTAILERHGIPLTLDVAEVDKLLLSFDAAQRAAVEADGIVAYEKALDGSQEMAWPLWSVALRYHWTQTFPAGASVTVAHAYDNRPPGGLFYWQDPPQHEWLAETAAHFCIDAETSRGIAAILPVSEDGEQVMGMMWNIAYILRTANSWAGPIGHFRLTLDKGAEDRILSLCAEGIRKTGSTTFELERRDYVPDSDLDILVVAPFPE
jgi:hypothetical protein